MFMNEISIAKLQKDVDKLTKMVEELHEALLSKNKPEESPGMAKYRKRKKYTGFDLVLAVINGSLAEQKTRDYEELKKIEKGLEDKTLTKAEAKEKLTAITGEEYD